MVWRKKWTAATWLFILNRYLLVAYTILSIVPYTPRVSAIPFTLTNIQSDLTGIICTMQDVRVSCISGFFYPSLAIISCIGTAQLVNLVNLSQYIVFARTFTLFSWILIATYTHLPVFSALRAYAIHNFNIAIFLAVFSLNVIPVGTNIVSCRFMTAMQYYLMSVKSIPTFERRRLTSVGSVPSPPAYLPISVSSMSPFRLLHLSY